MKLAIHLGTFRRATLVEALDAVSAQGLKCVHFNLAATGLPSMPERIDGPLCAQIARELAIRGLSEEEVPICVWFLRAKGIA